jgi:hypothetical protein
MAKDRENKSGTDGENATPATPANTNGGAKHASNHTAAKKPATGRDYWGGKKSK